MSSTVTNVNWAQYPNSTYPQQNTSYPDYSQQALVATQAVPQTPTINAQGPYNNPYVKRMQAQHFKEMGNEMLRVHLVPQAIHAYRSAIQTDTTYTDAYFNLSQVYRMVGDIPKASWWMSQLLTINPNDHDSRVLLGELYEKQNLRPYAKRLYMQVLGAQPNFDPARRNLNYMLFEDQSKAHPETAFELLKTTEKELIFKIRNLLKQYYGLTNAPEDRRKLAETINIVFEPTQVMDNTENIAEYDHPKKTIRLQSKMMFSSPNVAAAYVAHELIHAQDQDGETSIKEEQDGYRELVQFWQRFKNAESEPNLDRALALYEDNPAKLDDEVKRLYTMRNPLIAETSPNHGQGPKSQAQQILGNIQQRYNQYVTERLKKWFGFYSPSVISQAQFTR